MTETGQVMLTIIRDYSSQAKNEAELEKAKLVSFKVSRLRT